MCVEMFAGKAWNSMVLVSIPLKKKKKKAIKPLCSIFNSAIVKQHKNFILLPYRRKLDASKKQRLAKLFSSVSSIFTFLLEKSF